MLCSCKPGLLWYTRFSLSPSSRGLGRRPFKAKIAGSNPAGGTIEATSPVPSRCRAFCCPAPGVEPGGRETERTRERSPASVRGRKAPGAADPRSGDANPAGGTIEATSPVPSRCRAFCCPAPGVEPGGRETERTRERSPASVRGRKAPGAADPRSGDANPAGGTIEATSPVPSRCRAFC